MSKTDLNTFKDRLAPVKDMIRKTLKVDAGTQNAYDIMAVSQGYPHYHAVKAVARLPFYELKANLGTRDKPFEITLDVGHWAQLCDAEATARELLEACRKFQTWFLYRDGDNTHIKFDTTPAPEKGLVYQIELTGNTLSDIEIALEEVTERIDNAMGFDSNDSGSFSFQRVGDEVDPFAGTDDIAVDEGDDFVVFDNTGAVYGCDNELSVLHLWDNADTILDEWDDFLIHARQITLDQLIEHSNEPGYDDEFYHAIGKDQFDQTHFIHGSAGDVLETLKEVSGQTSLSYSLYKEMDRK